MREVEESRATSSCNNDSVASDAGGTSTWCSGRLSDVLYTPNNNDNAFRIRMCPPLGIRSVMDMDMDTTIQESCYGVYAHIRETLDYNYHCDYSEERQHFQDKIITEALMTAESQPTDCLSSQFLVFTAGAMGVGKSHTIQELSKKGHFPLSKFVIVDPDEIRKQLPEYETLVTENPSRAGELTSKEAGLISEILVLAALQSGKHILVDGTLQDWQWYAKEFVQLRENYVNLKIAIIYVDAPNEVIFQRAKIRGITTGRMIPQKTLKTAWEQVSESMNILKDHADFYCELNNSPGLDSVQLKNDMTGSTFRKYWVC
jgi:predicted kinase